MKQHDSLSCRSAGQRLAGYDAVLMTFFLAVATLMVCSAGAIAASLPPETPAPHSVYENKLGIQIVGLRRSAAGHMLDFRYRLLDPAKASSLLDRKIRPYLLDETTGAQLGVPTAPKVGQLRPTSRNKVIPGRTYYILFANPGRFLNAGSKVTLVAGDVKIRNLTVE